MKLNYCPECACPLTQQTETKYVCTNDHPYYNNPHTTCTIVFVNEQAQLLYAKRGREPAKGKYDFPGSFAEFREDGYQAALRELQEELHIQLHIEDLQLIDCAQHDYLENVSTCSIVFICRKWQGIIIPGDDVVALEWKPLNFLKSPEFAWPYPYLYDKLQKVIDKHEPAN